MTFTRDLTRFANRAIEGLRVVALAALLLGGCIVGVAAFIFQSPTGCAVSTCKEAREILALQVGAIGVALGLTGIPLGLASWGARRRRVRIEARLRAELTTLREWTLAGRVPPADYERVKAAAQGFLHGDHQGLLMRSAGGLVAGWGLLVLTIMGAIGAILLGLRSYPMFKDPGLFAPITVPFVAAIAVILTGVVTLQAGHRAIEAGLTELDGSMDRIALATAKDHASTEPVTA